MWSKGRFGIKCPDGFDSIDVFTCLLRSVMTLIVNNKTRLFSQGLGWETPWDYRNPAKEKASCSSEVVSGSLRPASAEAPTHKCLSGAGIARWGAVWGSAIGNDILSLCTKVPPCVPDQTSIQLPRVSIVLMKAIVVGTYSPDTNSCDGFLGQYPQRTCTGCPHRPT